MGDWILTRRLLCPLIRVDLEFWRMFQLTPSSGRKLQLFSILNFINQVFLF